MPQAIKKKRTAGRGKLALTDSKKAQLIKMKVSGKYTVAYLCEKFGISSATLYNYCTKY